MDNVFGASSGLNSPAVRNKGRSLLAFPKDYTVIDIETTGLSPSHDVILEISAVKCRDCASVDCFSELVRPLNFLEVKSDFPGVPYVPEFITDLTGITDDMLCCARTLPEILPGFLGFISDDILMGHNVNFDINFLYDSIEQHLELELNNDFVDTLRLSRRVNKNLESHSLSRIADFYSIDHSTSHRALSDCEIVNQCYLRMRDEVLSRFSSFDDFFLSQKRARQHVRASEISCTSSKIDTDNPFFLKTCVFTGALERMTRREAMQIVVNLGGFVGDNVTKKTDFLILGNNNYCPLIQGSKSSKQRKAEKLKSSGQDIDIIPEDIFYELLDFDSV